MPTFHVGSDKLSRRVTISPWLDSRRTIVIIRKSAGARSRGGRQPSTGTAGPSPTRNRDQVLNEHAQLFVLLARLFEDGTKLDVTLQDACTGALKDQGIKGRFSRKVVYDLEGKKCLRLTFHNHHGTSVYSGSLADLAAGKLNVLRKDAKSRRQPKPDSPKKGRCRPLVSRRRISTNGKPQISANRPRRIRPNRIHLQHRDFFRACWTALNLGDLALLKAFCREVRDWGWKVSVSDPRCERYTFWVQDGGLNSYFRGSLGELESAVCQPAEPALAAPMDPAAAFDTQLALNF